MNLIEHINQAPPFLYALMASESGRFLRPCEIATASGLSKSTIRRLSVRRDWSDVSIATAVKFCAACGFDLMRPSLVLGKLEQAGGKISDMRHLQYRKGDPLWVKGSTFRRLKFLEKAVIGK